MSEPTDSIADMLQRTVQVVCDLLGCRFVALLPPTSGGEALEMVSAGTWVNPLSEDLSESKVLAVPVVVDEEVIATLQARGPVSGDFDERDRRVVRMLVDLMATAIARERQAGDLRQELDHSMARLRAVLDYQTDLICRFRPDGILTFVNLTYCRYFARERESLIGHSFLPLVFEEDREATRRHLASFGRDRPVATTERQVLAAGGKLRWQQWIDRPVFDAAGHIVEFQSVGRDITEQKQQELELHRYREHLEDLVETRTAELRASREHLRQVNEELTRAARLKDEFLANMSHELRTPLTSILGLSEVLNDELFGSLTERQARAVQTINTSGQHLLSLINDILDVSKIEAGKLELMLGVVEIHSVCEAAWHLVEPEIGKKLLTCAYVPPPAGTLWVVDPRRLKQILVNLLGNAVKFTPEGGRIGLDVTVEEGASLYLAVWDTGIGIAADDQARLFRPFVQLDSRLSREYGGSGLGLALVQRLIALHGGRIQVASEVGCGSRFTVTLPYRELAQPNDGVRDTPTEQAEE